MMFFTLVRVELGQFLLQHKPVLVSIDSPVQKYADLKLLSKAKMLLKQAKPFRIKIIIKKTPNQKTKSQSPPINCCFQLLFKVNWAPAALSPCTLLYLEGFPLDLYSLGLVRLICEVLV